MIDLHIPTLLFDTLENVIFMKGSTCNTTLKGICGTKKQRL